MGHRAYQNDVILNAPTATGAGKVINCEDYEHIVVSFATDGGNDAALTVQFQGSIESEAPDFDSAVSVTNHWVYIDSLDYPTGSSLDGATGIAVATADGYTIVELNISGLKWFTANMTARTEGEPTVKVKMFN